MKRKDFILNLIYYILPMVLVIPLSIWGISQMSKATYDCFFVMGTSMQPYLSGDKNNSTYGYSDNSDYAISRLERFDLVICYYPFGHESDYQLPYNRENPVLLDSCKLKVKRVIGLPGDSLVINDEEFSISYTVNNQVVTDSYNEDNCPFQRNKPISNRHATISLGPNEYFVMGDNWTELGSLDCCNPTKGGTPTCLYKENIVGVIFKLEGTCTYKEKNHCKACKKIVDDDCTKCRCGSTQFLKYNDIDTKTPYDKPIYIK